MDCSGCGFQIKSSFAFCPNCGARQPVPCSSCGYPCPPDFAFCPQCGTRTAAKVNDQATSTPSRTAARLPPQEAEGQPASAHAVAHADRRTVTILFADLSGFTALSEQLDPEIVQTLQNTLFSELTAAVQSFDGFVDKFIGDALLALFGAPVPHEDDPERALRAALDMLDRIGRLGENDPAIPNMVLHIGINTGPVVAGGLGAGTAKSYSVTGDTVNTGQRLQSLAAPGEVLIGPLTYRLTRHAFSYESLGDVVLRGKAGSVLVHRLGGPLASPRAARGLEVLGLGAPLIGRDAELQRMLASLDQACGGSAQLLRLVGEAGIGKSRMVSELITRIGSEERFRHVAIRQTACSSLGDQPYGAIGAVVRSAAGMMQNDAPDEMRGMACCRFCGRSVKLTRPSFRTRPG